MKKLAFFIFLVYLLIVCFDMVEAARPKSNCREKTINECLTMVLLVGSDMRGQGKHPTWQEISDEVARRMK